ncbi:hypothetical protein ACFX2F_037935 [Malus domestica]
MASSCSYKEDFQVQEGEGIQNEEGMTKTRYLFMTRSSNPVQEHILDFDDDFERELRRKRKNPEPSESSASSESVSEVEEEVEDMAADN